jgi:hypothetical protein
MKKNTRSTLIAFIFTLSVTGANAQAFTEGFDTLANLASTGWEMFNLSNPAPVSYNWEHGYPANTNTTNRFTAYAGVDTNSYISSSFNAVVTQGTISHWLLTPHATLSNGDTLSFWTRTTSVGTSIYPDRMQVRFSRVSGNNVGTSENDIGDFNDLMVDINEFLTTVDYPLVWTQYALPVTGLTGSVTGRFAFRYYVTDGGVSGANSFLVAIDEVSYVPAAVGINIISNSVQGFSVYPNPATDMVNFRMEIPVKSNAEVTIFNSMGQVVSKGFMQQGTRMQILDVSKFEAGVYTVNVKDAENAIYRSNFVK